MSHKKSSIVATSAGNCWPCVNLSKVALGKGKNNLSAESDFLIFSLRPPAILFTETKERCQRIMGELLYDGINAMSLCAAKTPQERHRVIQVRVQKSDQSFSLVLGDSTGKSLVVDNY